MNWFLQNRYIAPLGIISAGILLWISWKLLPVATVLFWASTMLLVLQNLRAVWKFWQITKAKKLFLVLLGVLALHAVGVLLPETGFDALWYQLPLTHVYTTVHGIIYVPELFHSAFPSLGTLIFVFPYAVAGTLGVKLWCWLVMTQVLGGMWRLSQRFVFTDVERVLLILVIALFQVIAWQASSAYVDLFRAWLEILALIQLTEKRSQWSVGVLYNVSAILTKSLVLLFLPIWIAVLFISFSRRKAVYASLILCGLVGIWYVVSSLRFTGNAFMPLISVFQTQQIITSVPSNQVWLYVVKNIASFPVIPLRLAAIWPDYVTSLFVLCFPFFFFSAKKLFMRQKMLVSFSVLTLLLWVLIPPLSVRYGLTGICVLLLLGWSLLHNLNQKSKKFYLLFLVVCLLDISIHVLIRAGVAWKAMPYLLGKESSARYVQLRTEPIALGPTQKWYSGYWKAYAESLLEKKTIKVNSRNQ